MSSDSLQFTASLPRKRMAAGALLRDAQGRILIVEPTYRPHWLIPGGVVEVNESPLTACVREVLEETALRISPLRLLCVDHQAGDADSTEAMHFIFDGGQLDAEQLGAIRLPPEELSAFRFVSLSEAYSLVSEKLVRRLSLALDALDTGETVYAENGARPPGQLSEFLGPPS